MTFLTELSNFQTGSKAAEVFSKAANIPAKAAYSLF